MHNTGDFLSEDIIEMLKRQQYKMFGHSAVKLCHWTKASLYKGQSCYKQKFYGIQSHRCLQMTPSVAWCDQNCSFCWRPLTKYKPFPENYDEPGEIIDEAVKQQRILLTGYGEFREKIGDKKLDEANNPNQAAISLAGEPTLYPKISGLIEEFNKRKFSTFIVSNGLHPNVLGEMVLPTQLYLSLDAPNKDLHKKVNAPLVKGSWDSINQSLELFPSLDTRTALRITAIKDRNMFDEADYAKLIEKADPDFVEIKAYMFVGYSRKRLAIENMPLHNEVRDFAEKINQELGYHLTNEVKPSRVVLLSKKKKNAKISSGQ